ncbi:phospholipase [Yinghuangia sp. ASG 101]|uniref:phospholipase n=1 Tax=Yinghuangia sp. ASG 101 TaxID=2896848 RepID=UPI001E43E9C6|nr:phospholipase [Yinghuangia sp. ASG 101]UGQ09525.1 phospholipase [Yinghuangia sp. ASG 101]
MPTRTASPAPRVAATAAAIAGSLALALAPAPAAAAPRDAVATTDRLLFTETLPSFVAIRASADRPADVDWSSDGCSNAPDAPFGYDFTKACWRHDFGYRNYKAQNRFTEDARLRIDNRFRDDMNTLCGSRSLCRATASLYYEAVREFGS